MSHLELCLTSSRKVESSPDTLYWQSPSYRAQRPPTLAESQKSKQSPHQAKESPFGLASDIIPESPGLDEVQEAFNAIKNSVDKVILPSYMMLHDSGTGIKRKISRH